MPKNIERARHPAFRSARFHRRFHLARSIANNSLLPPLSIRNSIATRALHEATSTLELRRFAKSSYQKALILPI
jgi:hypothetical protein